MSEIFLSYARIDNDRADNDSYDGWISYFHARLCLLLSQKLGKRVEFWRDVQEIEPGEGWHGSIKEALGFSRILLAVLSPAFVNSNNTKFELNEFIDLKKQIDRDKVKEAVLKVLKHPVDQSVLPAELHEPEAFTFFINDRERGGDVALYSSFTGLRKPNEYMDELERLANRLKHALEASAEAEPPPTLTAYVAVPSPSSELSELYSRLAQELHRRGAGVVPDRRKFFSVLDEPNPIVLEQAVTNSRVAIHLLDPTAGEDAMRLDLRQLDETAGRARSTDRLRRFIWIAPKRRNLPDNEAVASLRRLVDTGGRQVEGDQVVEEPFERFLDMLLRLMFPHAPSHEIGPQVGADRKPGVYVLCGVAERAEVIRFAVPELKRREVRCTLPLSSESDSRDREDFEAKELRSCDGVAIYWGAQSERWLHEQLARLEDWPDLGRREPFARRFVIVGPPDMQAKRELFLDEDEVDVINLLAPAGAVPTP